jgi:hypothetical protein
MKLGRVLLQRVALVSAVAWGVIPVAAIDVPLVVDIANIYEARQSTIASFYGHSVITRTVHWKPPERDKDKGVFLVPSEDPPGYVRQETFAWDREKRHLNKTTGVPGTEKYNESWQGFDGTFFMSYSPVHRIGRIDDKYDDLGNYYGVSHPTSRSFLAENTALDFAMVASERLGLAGAYHNIPYLLRLPSAEQRDAFVDLMGFRCVLVQIPEAGMKIWFDSDHGLAVRQVQEFGGGDFPLYTYTNMELSDTPYEGDIWLPVRSRKTVHLTAPAADTEQGLLMYSIDYEFTGNILNSALPESLFHLDKFPVRTLVTNSITGERYVSDNADSYEGALLTRLEEGLKQDPPGNSSRVHEPKFKPNRNPAEGEFELPWGIIIPLLSVVVLAASYVLVRYSKLNS